MKIRPPDPLIGTDKICSEVSSDGGKILSSEKKKWFIKSSKWVHGTTRSKSSGKRVLLRSALEYCACAESSARWNLCLKELIFWGSYMRMKFHEVHWLEWKEAELLTVICIAWRDRCGKLSQSTGRFSIDWSWEEATDKEIPVGIDVASGAYFFVFT